MIAKEKLGNELFSYSLQPDGRHIWSNKQYPLQLWQLKNIGKRWSARIWLRWQGSKLATGSAENSFSFGSALSTSFCVGIHAKVLAKKQLRGADAVAARLPCKSTVDSVLFSRTFWNSIFFSNSNILVPVTCINVISSREAVEPE